MRPVLTNEPANDAVTPTATTQAERSSPLRIRLLAGVDMEVWQGTPAASIEPRLGGGVMMPHTWSLSLWAGYGWGIDSAGAVETRCLRGALQFDFLLVPQVQLGVGLGIRRLLATVPVSMPPRDHDAAAVGFIASGRYVLPLAALSISVVPTLEVLTQPLAVQVDGREVFRIPRLIAGLSIEGSAEL